MLCPVVCRVLLTRTRDQNQRQSTSLRVQTIVQRRNAAVTLTLSAGLPWAACESWCELLLLELSCGELLVPGTNPPPKKKQFGSIVLMGSPRSFVLRRKVSIRGTKPIFFIFASLTCSTVVVAVFVFLRQPRPPTHTVTKSHQD